MENLEEIFQAKVDAAFNSYKEVCLRISVETKNMADLAETEEEKSKALIYQKTALDKALSNYSQTLKGIHRDFMKAYEEASTEFDNCETNRLDRMLNQTP